MNHCTKCNFETRTFAKLVIHYRFVHSHERDFQITCSVDGCVRTYNNTDSFLKHVKRKHKTFHENHLSRWREFNAQADVAQNLQPIEDNCLDSDGENLLDNAEEQNEIDISDIDFKRRFAIFLLNLRENFKLPSNSISQVVNELTDMICFHQAEVLKKVISFCSDKGLGEGEIDQLKLLMTEQSQIESACLQLNSEYKLNKYVRENFGFVPPVQYDLNRNSKHGKYQYIPIFQTLEKLLSHDDVFSYIINDHQSGENNLRDFCDGDLYKNHELFSSDHTALQIIFYFDEFTASNPIGHKVKNFKIGAFYMTLGNIPPKYRSQLYTIQLVALCMSSLLKTHGFKEVLQPLIYDLKLLETEGITITKSDGDHKFYGSLSVVLADNLGAHGIGGFLESFSCLRNCRFCFVTRDNMQTQLNCDDFNLRTEEMHSAQLKNLERDSSLSSVYGVKGDSPLNSLEYFHVTQGLPSDLAHDLFEGVVCYVLTNTVESLVRAGLFTLEDLNDAILNFQFEMTDVSNKPTTVQKTLRNFNIKQTAAQTWCLARFLPLIIGGKINRGNAIWETYLHLRDMLFYVCAPAINRGQVLFMKEIIEDFHESYRQNYPNDTVKPKFHFTLHYPMETLKFGPLIHLQTLRFEGKHNYFKELVYRTKNKINICKSLALRHQYYQCIFTASDNFLHSGQFDTSNGSVTPVCLLKDEYQEFLREALHESTEVYLANSVSCNGIKYIKGGSLIRSQDGDLFCFNRIRQCVVIHGKIYFLCTRLRTVNFDCHYHAYIVCDTNECDVVKLETLKEPHMYGLYHCSIARNSFFVVLKYNVLLD
ncbi:uncharacterized protein [Mytilus edulis]|uniref:uncharacterized protein n=1 Tax=Mytilus edulis TaxID=6550 RepID=UPI0039F036BC